MNNSELIDISKSAQKFSYSPYSNFKVGAALLTNSGEVFTGCNIENAAYSMTNCAERTALFKAVSEGYNKFKAIAITSSSDEFTYPCGACLQCLMEFSPDIEVVLSNKFEIKVFKLTELLPHSFNL